MNRVISYIDGFNLYFGLKSKGWRKYYWLDLTNLSRDLLKENQTLAHCYYFTARIRTASDSQGQNSNRQNIWLDALSTLPDLSIQYGHYLQKPKICKSCGAKWMSHEEKMTDVNIAAQLLSDAYENKFDTALIISGDSDLTTPVKLVRERFPDKRVIIAFPPDRHSDQLRKTANSAFTIGESKLRNNLLPNSITTTTGYVLHRPERWY
jgi:uncharacterized LabA/DUF88 family protein